MKFKRLILGIIFTLLIFLLCYNYAFNYHNALQNEDRTDLTKDNTVITLENYVFMLATVTDEYDDGIIVEVYNNDSVNYYKIKTPSKKDVGYPVVIFGTISSNNEIVANKILIRSTSEMIFIIFRSFIGLILFLLIFLKYWKFDFRKIEFKRRLRKINDFPNHQNKKFWRI